MVTVLFQLLLKLTDNYVYIVFRAKSLANGVTAKVCGVAETIGHVKLAHIFPVGVFWKLRMVDSPLLSFILVPSAHLHSLYLTLYSVLATFHMFADVFCVLLGCFTVTF